MGCRGVRQKMGASFMWEAVDERDGKDMGLNISVIYESTLIILILWFYCGGHTRRHVCEQRCEVHKRVRRYVIVSMFSEQGSLELAHSCPKSGMCVQIRRTRSPRSCPTRRTSLMGCCLGFSTFRSWIFCPDS